MKKIVILSIGCLILSSCLRVIRPGEVGVKRKAGTLKDKIYPTGVYAINPIVTRMLKVPVRVINLEVNLEALPSKEGLSIATQMSILFHIIPDSAKSIISNIGIENGKAVITNVLRSAAADVTSNYYAKDMHSGGKREEIEKAISKKMTEHLGKLGYVVDAVLLKSIKLPIGLTQAIEEKLKAEQESQRMEFVLTREKSEVERKKIEAQGIKEYNDIISESLTGKLLKYQSIQAFKELSNSNNSKIIITNGSTPLFMSDEKSEEKEMAPAATE